MCDENEKANPLKTFGRYDSAVNTVQHQYHRPQSAEPSGLRVLQRETTLGGFFFWPPPKTRSHERVTDFVAHAKKKKHDTFHRRHPAKRTTRRNTSTFCFFVSVGHRLHGAAFALLRSVRETRQTVSFFFFLLHIFFPPYTR